MNQVFLRRENGDDSIPSKQSLNRKNFMIMTYIFHAYILLQKLSMIIFIADIMTNVQSSER